uniref:Phosphodiesterase 9A n=1 Tax=Mus musculus TaxID=10090 RepID=D6RGP8_MOUSE
MGAGSSSYRPKAIYLDIDGRIQKEHHHLPFNHRRRHGLHRSHHACEFRAHSLQGETCGCEASV